LRTAYFPHLRSAVARRSGVSANLTDSFHEGAGRQRTDSPPSRNDQTRSLILVCLLVTIIQVAGGGEHRIVTSILDDDLGSVLPARFTGVSQRKLCRCTRNAVSYAIRDEIPSPTKTRRARRPNRWRRVCWLGGWDKGRVFYVVMVVRAKTLQVRWTPTLP
jgi:hypothetical protein